MNMYKSEDNVICLSGGADPIHIGHIRLCRDASQYGKVIWILNSDDWLMKKKGYVFMPWEERKEVLLAIRYVDEVVPVADNNGTVVEALKIIRPTYFGNGGDRKQGNTPETIVCSKIGIECVWNLGGEKIQSSSIMVNQVVKDTLRKLENAI